MRTAFRSALVVLSLVVCGWAQDPCAGQHTRALVLGGGGSKGAFEAGAAYHLIVDRGCDFTEISGTSVGALNAALLAQAPRSDDPSQSLTRMQAQADALVAMYKSIRGTRDVMRGRPLAGLRFGLFGLEAMKNFAPMRRLLAANFSTERLDKGRALRVGALSFHDGAYREMVLNGEPEQRALDFIFGSAMIPMYGTMPRVALDRANPGDTVQFGDGSLRHLAPVTNFFVACAPSATPPQCRAAGNHGVPPHAPVEQIFVIVTAPYHQESLSRPVWDTSVFKPGTRLITDGRNVMSRALDIVLDSVQHSDLDSVLLGNELLKWREQTGANLTGFPVESYNYDPQHADGNSQAYRIGIISPLVGDGGLKDTLDFSPAKLANMLYCGCAAADAMMQTQFGLASMENKCRARFPVANDSVCQAPAARPVTASAPSPAPAAHGTD